MRILSVILVSKSRYVIVVVNFCKFIRFIVFSPVYYKGLLFGPCKSVASLYPELPYRSCKYSFSCNFPRFLSHLLYFKLSSLESFRSAFINSLFSFFAVIVLVNREVKGKFKLYESVFHKLFAVC